MKFEIYEKNDKYKVVVVYFYVFKSDLCTMSWGTPSTAWFNTIEEAEDACTRYLAKKARPTFVKGYK